MKIEDIIALARAGYTAEQINQLAAVGTPAQEEPKREPQPEPKQEPQQEPKPEPKAADDAYAKMLEAINGLKQTIQQQNVAGASLQTPKQLTADEVIANIIAPPRKEK